jgi:hypothetical protein
MEGDGVEKMADADWGCQEVAHDDNSSGEWINFFVLGLFDDDCLCY